MMILTSSAIRISALCLIVTLFIFLLAIRGLSNSDSLSFYYDQGKLSRALRDGEFRVHEKRLESVSGKIFVYATFGMPNSNPVPYVGGFPTGVQIVTLGQTTDGKFIPAIRFGIKEREQMASQQAQLMPWAFDGATNYYGGYARPSTTYDFRIELNTSRSRATVFTSGRGDDDWFLLAEEIPLIFPVTELNEVKVEQYVGATGIHDLTVLSHSQPERDKIKPSAVRVSRRVGPNLGFRLQAMRSLWREPGRHVTISRDENRWQGFADVVLSNSDKLLTTYCDGPKHGGNGKSVLRISHDLGKTWGLERKIVGFRGANERLQRLSNGSLLLISGEMLTTVELQQSFDDGQNWKVIGNFDVRSFGLKEHFAMSHLLESSDGTWFLVGSDFAGPEERERLQVFASKNQGKDWELRAIIDTFHDSGHSGSEASIIELPDGRLAIYARESRNDGFPGFRVFSRDEGKTWSPPEDLPIQVSGRVLAAALADGRVMMTTRTWIGRPALWAWVEDPLREIGFQISGVHFNDKTSKGLKDGILFIDNDGEQGQFTRYLLRPPNGPDDEVNLKASVMVLENQGRAATISIPFAGTLKIFPREAVFSGGQKDFRFPIVPETFHTYLINSTVGRLNLSIDGKPLLDTTAKDSRALNKGCLPAVGSPLLFAFGNYPSPEAFNDDVRCSTAMLPFQITREVTGLSLWRSVEASINYKNGTRQHTLWNAADGFPDQYQLDNVVEVEATVAGMDQGYSGWVQFPDQRLFVVNYTDDTAVIWPATKTSPYGCSWIRGTFILPSDLPPKRP